MRATALVFTAGELWVAPSSRCHSRRRKRGLVGSLSRGRFAGVRHVPKHRVGASALVWCGLLLLFLLGCEEGGGQANLRPLPPQALVLAFGDSLTHGSGAPSGSSYPEQLARLSGLSVLRHGVPGEVSAEGLKRLPQLLDRYHPDLLLLIHGGNDLLQGLSRDGTKANLRAMIQHARNSGAQVLMLGVPTPGLFISGSAPLYSELADELDLPYDDKILARVLKDRGLKSDLVHPNAEGYRVLAEAIHHLLKKQGAL